MPEAFKAYTNRGMAYTELKKYKEARKDFNKAIKLKSNFATAYFNRAIMYSRLKKYRKATSDYEKVIELKDLGEIGGFTTNKAYTYNNSAYAHLKLNQLLEAKKGLEKSQELDSENSWLYRNWSIYYTTQNDFPKAIQNLKKAIELGYDDKEFLQEEELLAPLRSHLEWQQIIESIDDKNSEK